MKIKIYNSIITFIIINHTINLHKPKRPHQCILEVRLLCKPLRSQIIPITWYSSGYKTTFISKCNTRNVSPSSIKICLMHRVFPFCHIVLSTAECSQSYQYNSIKTMLLYISTTKKQQNFFKNRKWLIMGYLEKTSWRTRVAN